jgi:hypothetical protein
MLARHPLLLAYAVAMAACLAIGVIVLSGALALAIWPRARRRALRLAGGVVGACPFMLFLQGLALPIFAILAAILSILAALSGAPGEAIAIAANGTFVLGLAAFVAASVLGAVVGFGVGARMATGAPLRASLRASRTLDLLAGGLNLVLPRRAAVSPAGGVVAGLGIIVVAAGGLALAYSAYVERYGSDEMDYRGEKIRLTKKYVDYDDYKNDPDNLAPSEIARVEQMMTQARIGPDFADRKEFVHQVMQIKFPGYGAWGGPRVAAAERQFQVEAIEIPQLDKDRYFVAEMKPGGSLRMVDDFVIAHKAGSPFAAISFIRLVDERLVYSDRAGTIVRETNVGPPR